MTAADSEAFSNFVNSNFEQLSRYARTLCRLNLTSHEDVVNEAVVYLAERSYPWSSIEPDEAGLICRRACVAAKKELGRKARRNFLREPSMGLVPDLSVYDQNLYSDEGGSNNCTRELRILMRRADLNPRELQVMLVKTMDSAVTLQEVANLLELSYKQVDWAFYRARRKLKNALEAGGEEENG